MRAKLFSGLLLLAAAPAFAQTVNLEAARRDVQIAGSRTEEWLGRPLVCGDFDGDGHDDLVVGTDPLSIPPGETTRVYIFRGAADFLTRGLIDLADPGTSPDVTIFGESADGELATAMAVGDFNGDGRQDLALADSVLTAVPTSGPTRPGAGVVYILYGGTDFFDSPTRDLATTGWDVKILGVAAGDDMGGSNLFGGLVSSGLAFGDLNNDTRDDLAMGAHLADPNGRNAAGTIRVLYGEDTGATQRLYDLATETDVLIAGGQSDNELGTALAFGDVNGDTIDDLVAGQEYYSVTTFSSEGAVHVFFGQAGFPSTINLATQSPSVRIVAAVSYDTMGGGVAVADINGDTIGDVLTSVTGWDSKNSSSIDEGAVYGFLGRGTWPAQINLSSAAADVRVLGASNVASLGSDLATGDFDGDVYTDFITSARDSSRGVFPGEGRTFVIKGAPTFAGAYDLEVGGASHVINGGAVVRQLGDANATGDLNGDGLDEIIISVPFVNSGTGVVYIFGTPLPDLAASGQSWVLYE